MIKKYFLPFGFLFLISYHIMQPFITLVHDMLHGHESLIMIVQSVYGWYQCCFYVYCNGYLFLIFSVQTTALKNGSFRHDIHYWLGKDTSQVDLQTTWHCITSFYSWELLYMSFCWLIALQKYPLFFLVGWGWNCCNFNCGAWCCAWRTCCPVSGITRQWNWKASLIF